MNDPMLRDEFESDPADRLERIEELIWFCFDDQLDDQQAQELQQALLADPEARSRYVEAADLHAGLYSFFNEDKQAPAIAPALALPLGDVGLPTTG